MANVARKACRPGVAPSTVGEDTTTTRPRPGPDEPPEPEATEEVKDSKRRELITSAAAVAFGASLEDPVHRIFAAADQPQVSTRVRAGDVEYLREAWEILRAWQARLGRGAVRHHALAALRWGGAMLEESSCTPQIRRELALMTAKLADSAAWYTFDAGQHEPARQLSLLGLQAARESGNLGMRSWVAAGLARQETYAGNWVSGLVLYSSLAA